MKVRIVPESEADESLIGDIVSAVQQAAAGRQLSYSVTRETRPVFGLSNFLMEIPGVEIRIGEKAPEPAPEPPQESASWRDRPPLL